MKQKTSKKKKMEDNTDTSKSLEVLIKKAIDEHKRGDLSKAEKSYREIIKTGLKHPAIFFNLGLICQKSRRSEEAISQYKKAIETNPKDPSPHCNLGNLYMELGNFGKAKAHTLHALNIQPNNPNAYLILGWINKETGDLDRALKYTLKSTEIKPNYAESYINLGAIYREIGKLDKALESTLKSLSLKPEDPSALNNLGSIYKELGALDKALSSTLKSLEANPSSDETYINLGSIYKELGNPDKALRCTLRALKLNPKNYKAYMNLGSIYKNLGELDKALASTYKSLELRPEDSKATCKLGLIKMAQGKMIEAKQHFKTSIKQNKQETEAYHALSIMLETTEEAQDLIQAIRDVEADRLAPNRKLFIEFALSNCFHKLKKYHLAEKLLKAANITKARAYPPNTDKLKKAISTSLSCQTTKEETVDDTKRGEGRIFIVGMPRSGSTLLETVLSMNPRIKDLGETNSLKEAITEYKQRSYNCKPHNLEQLYSQMEPFNKEAFKYTTDKNLQNYIFVDYIATHMPGAKIIHCRRNPMDNILSMHRSNLMAGHNYTANLEDLARIYIAQEEAMQIHKKTHPRNIFTFNYDRFVTTPREFIFKILDWLDLEFDEIYLHPENSTRSINTASAMQARKPINNTSVGGWKNYETLLQPALEILQANNITID